MDMQKFAQYGPGEIAKYDLPKNFELVGRTFDFVMDDGIDYTLKFIDKTTVEWNYENEAPQKASGYMCTKGDDTTYLVSYELEGTAKRTNHTWVIDLENWLVTRVLAVIGENPKFEYLIVPKYEFGAIRRDGVEIKPYPRHGFTDEMTGNVVQWNYGEIETVHVYYCSDFYRITYPPEKASSNVFNEALAKLPSSDEPTAYIKIKDGLYLFSLTEANMEKIVGAAMRFRSNTMALLQNYKRMYLVGRTFGTRIIDGELEKLHLTFGAHGKILDPQDDYIKKMMTDPNPFLV